ncbi:hypothetical protein Q1695_003409 [Nippostrongylus brasiliensis]|nr:hypothetical protein Q1695_003409 [Nippostrongylus brasiliensis]
MSDPIRCAYVIPKKGRKCRMLVRTGQQYCGEHAVFAEDNQDRIQCPIDPKHTVDRKSLEQHLLRCNSRVVEAEYIKKDANALVGETKFTDKIDRRATEEEIFAALEKMKSCYVAVKDKLLSKQDHCQEVDAFLEQATTLSESKRKHLIQLSSIIGRLESAKLLRSDPSACILELGAGKAQLAYWMTKRAPLAKFLLIDRSGSRNKYDNRALKEDPSLDITRLRCSIEHVDLSELAMLKDVSSVCAVCKHFCGSATDAGIRCLSNGMENGLVLDGFVLVPCCHHKSRYSEYSGRDFLSKWNMDSESDFAALRHIATWAVCGFSKMQNEDCSPETSVENDKPSTEAVPWSPLWKEEMGRRGKLILEFGRAFYLSSLGFRTQVVEYVPPTVSPENLLILGLRRNDVEED